MGLCEPGSFWGHYALRLPCGRYHRRSRPRLWMSRRPAESVGVIDTRSHPPPLSRTPSTGAPHYACSAPPFAKGGRIHFTDFPIKKVVIARPRVDLAPANLTTETARVLELVMLPCGDVRKPAIGAAKIFSRPYATCHPAIMRSLKHVFQPSSVP